MLKGGSLFSRILYRRELDSYREEWIRCEQEVDSLTGWGPVDLSGYIEDIGLDNGEVRLPGFGTAAGFRDSMRSCLRFPGWSLPPRRLYSFFHRAVNKLLLRRKKVFPRRGVLIAISGVDGSGKSTLLGEVFDTFSRFLTVRKFSLGKPQGPVLEMLRRAVRGDRSRRRSSKDSAATAGAVRKPGAVSSVSAIVLALMRLRAASRAHACASRGYLVVSDRWPTDEPGMMDGPRLQQGMGGSLSLFARLCSRIERWAYRRMPRADICVFLQAPESVLLERNRGRVKQGKESDEHILERSQHNRQFRPLALETVYFDNDGPLSQKRNELLSCLWHKIVSNQDRAA